MAYENQIKSKEELDDVWRNMRLRGRKRSLPRCINRNFQELEKFRINLINRKRSITTEETTKISLLLPLFRLLGYDTENPDEVMPSMPVMYGLKSQKKLI